MNRFIRLWLVLLVGTIAMARSAWPQAPEAVWDPLEIARISEQAAEMSDMVLATVDLLDQMNALAATVGRYGALSTLDFPRFDASAVLSGLAEKSDRSTALPAAVLRTAAAEDGYALALHRRQSLTAVSMRGKTLAAAAAAASDMRGDLAADNATALAGLDQLIGLEATLAAVLQIRAGDQLRMEQAAPDSQGKLSP
ncbi:MAG TPA: hypothetical protein HPQ04_10935 [Rhodospirillaceae bacterium]|nr:hypothetical protein [Rhodospirillaceae bacterium]